VSSGEGDNLRGEIILSPFGKQARTPCLVGKMPGGELHIESVDLFVKAEVTRRGVSTAQGRAKYFMSR